MGICQAGPVSGVLDPPLSAAVRVTVRVGMVGFGWIRFGCVETGTPPKTFSGGFYPERNSNSRTEI